MSLQSLFVAYILDQLKVQSKAEKGLPSIDVFIEDEKDTCVTIKVAQITLFFKYCYEITITQNISHEQRSVIVEQKSSGEFSGQKNYEKNFDMLSKTLKGLDTKFDYSVFAKYYLCKLYKTWLPEESADLIKDDIIRISNLKQNRVNSYTVKETAEKLFNHLQYLGQIVKKNADLDQALFIIYRFLK